jgi:Actin
VSGVGDVGFGQRVKNELERLAVKGTKIKIFAPPERKYTTWIGGSILAGLGTFRKAFPTLIPLTVDVGQRRRISRRS